MSRDKIFWSKNLSHYTAFLGMKVKVNVFSVLTIIGFSEIAQYYVLINRAKGPYEKIFVLTFKAYGADAVRSMRLKCQSKYFLYGPKSRLIKALLYTYTNKIVYDGILLS